VEDVERELSVVVSGDVHPESISVGDLRGHHRGLAQHDHPSLSKFQRDALGAAGGAHRVSILHGDPNVSAGPLHPRRLRFAIERRRAEPQEGSRAGRNAERLTGECHDAPDGFAGSAAVRDRVVRQEPVLTREDEGRRLYLSRVRGDMSIPNASDSGAAAPPMGQ
jgi:hypothetical protein